MVDDQSHPSAAIPLRPATLHVCPLRGRERGVRSNAHRLYGPKSSVTGMQESIGDTLLCSRSQRCPGVSDLRSTLLAPWLLHPPPVKFARRQAPDIVQSAPKPFALVAFFGPAHEPCPPAGGGFPAGEQAVQSPPMNANFTSQLTSARSCRARSDRPSRGHSGSWDVPVRPFRGSLGTLARCGRNCANVRSLVSFRRPSSQSQAGRPCPVPVHHSTERAGKLVAGSLRLLLLNRAVKGSGPRTLAETLVRRKGAGQSVADVRVVGGPIHMKRYLRAIECTQRPILLRRVANTILIGH